MRREVLTIAGSSGQLEARLELPESADDPRVFGVACHPHSLKGGSMDNKVAHTLARAMVECGVVGMVDGGENRYIDGGV